MCSHARRYPHRPRSRWASPRAHRGGDACPTTTDRPACRDHDGAGGGCGRYASAFRLGFIFVALLLATFLVALDQTIVATTLPTVVGELGGLNHLSWVMTAYLLAQTASTPLYGKLGDQYGRKLVFQVAIIIFLAGSAVSIHRRCGLLRCVTIFGGVVDSGATRRVCGCVPEPAGCDDLLRCRSWVGCRARSSSRW
ncbi:MAG TPA: MFS transporter [Sporichthyaceae bacterium]